MQLALIQPDATYENSYREYLNELHEANEAPVPFVLGFTFDSFTELLERLENYSRGIGLAEGFVPHSTYWLVDTENQEILGVANMRHQLNEHLLEIGGHIGYGIRPSCRGKGYGTLILKESLEKLKNLGISRVFITCGKDNLASERVIRANGGVFASESYVDSAGEWIRRFWLDNT